MDTKTEARSQQSSVMQPAARRTPLPPWAEAVLAGYRARWPAVFTKPVPLASGISRHMKAALLADGEAADRKALGVVLHLWTMQSAYLRAMARGDMRRNLDGSEADLPDEAARQHAQSVLDERAARQAERTRRKEERKQVASKIS